MPDSLKRLRLRPEQIRPLIWLFPIASIALGATNVARQYRREAELRAEFASVAHECVRLEALSGSKAHENHDHDH